MGKGVDVPLTDPRISPQMRAYLFKKGFRLKECWEKKAVSPWNCGTSYFAQSHGGITRTSSRRYARVGKSNDPCF